MHQQLDGKIPKKGKLKNLCLEMKRNDFCAQERLDFSRIT